MTDAQSISFQREQVTGADWSRQVLEQFSAVGSTFTECRFDRAKIQQAAFGSGAEQSEYVRCSFDGTSLRALGGFTRFVNCTFRNVRATKAVPDYLEFVDCTFTGKLTGLPFWGAPLDAPGRYQSYATFLARQGRPEPPWLEELFVRDRNDIRGNDFSTATLVDVTFRFGVDLTAQKLPVGDDYVYLPEAATTLPRAQAALAQDPAEKADEARSWLGRVLDRSVAQEGQHQLFLREKDYVRKGELPPEIALAFRALRDVNTAT